MALRGLVDHALGLGSCSDECGDGTLGSHAVAQSKKAIALRPRSPMGCNRLGSFPLHVNQSSLICALANLLHSSPSLAALPFIPQQKCTAAFARIHLIIIFISRLS